MSRFKYGDEVRITFPNGDVMEWGHIQRQEDDGTYAVCLRDRSLERYVTHTRIYCPEPIALDAKVRIDWPNGEQVWGRIEVREGDGHYTVKAREDRRLIGNVPYDYMYRTSGLGL